MVSSDRQRQSGRTDWVVGQLIDLIRQKSEQGEVRLPTVKALVVRFHVAPATICKALGILRARNILATAHRRGITIVTPVGAADIPTRDSVVRSMGRTAVWQQVKEKILADIVDGTFLPGSLLPTAKELMLRYRVCFTTLARALESLKDEGRIVHDRRRFAVYMPQSSHRRPILIVIAWASTAEAIVGLSARAIEFWHTLERECQNRSMDLELYTVDEAVGAYSGSSERYRKFLSRPQTRVIAGYFVWIQQTTLAELDRLCTLLARTRLPVALLDEVGTSGIPRTVTNNPHFQLFSLSIGIAPGRVVGEYALNLGHRRIACFSAFSKLPWSINRIAGIEALYASAGFRGAVSIFEIDAYDRWRPLWERHKGDEPYSTMQHFLHRMQRVVNKTAAAWDSTLYSVCIGALWRGMLESIMAPLFTRALSNSSITLWVGTNDDIALCAQKFLRARMIDVPRKISLIGIDDTIESIGADITSYNLNVAAIARAMLDHVLGGRLTRSIAGNAPIEIPGVIMERGSTKKRALAVGQAQGR